MSTQANRLLKLETKITPEQPLLRSQHIVDKPTQVARMQEIARMIADGEGAATDIFFCVVTPGEEQ